MKLPNLLFKNKSYKDYLLLLFLMFSFSVFAQKVTIKGTVTDAVEKFPIPGVSVVVQGTTNGVSTDFDGNYAINAKIGDILVFKYLGMKDVTRKIKTTTLNVAMEASVEALEEVVVIGYGTVKKKEITGAVSQVKAEDLESIVSSDIGTALQGQISGVNIVSSSDPGGDSEILIRGITSLSGDNTPLYVVDGVIQDGDPRIPPSDIETINVLKDAASTAIYGVRGATGVILITTKQGKPGSLQVRLNGSYAIQNRRAAVPLMNSLEQTYFDIVQSRNVNGAFDDQVSLQVLQQPRFLLNETNLNDLIFTNNVPIQNYNLNVSGGTNDITYNVSTGFFSQEGLQINSGYNRFNIRASTVYEKDKIRIQSSVALMSDNRDIPQGNLLSQSIVYRPTQNGINLDNLEELSQGGDDVNRLGWVIESLRTTNNLKSTRANATLNINYKITNNLSLASNFGYTSYSNYGKIYRPYQEIFNNQNPPILQSQPEDSFVSNRTRYTTNILAEVGATYNKEFNKDHNVTLTVFANAEKNKSEAFTATRNGATNPDVQVLNGATGTQFVSSGYDYTTTRIGLLGRAQYNYKGKYFLSSSLRRDGSSKFPEGNKWGVFPSVSFAWNISDEPFWKKYKGTVNNFRFRVSQGTVGVDRIPDYQFSAGISQDINYAASDGSLILGATQEDFVNRVLVWEETTQQNVGLDFGFFKNKLTLSAEYYHSDKTDMLFPVFIPNSSGGGNNATVVLNVGDMTNSGAELALGYRTRIGNARIRMNGTFSTNQNTVTKISGDTKFQLTNDNGLVGRAPQQSRITALAVGHEAAAFFLWRTNGILDTEEKLAEYQANIDSNARMGDTRFIDQNNDGVLDEADRVYSGSGLPKYEIGYTFNANYKNWDFSMNWYAALGQEIMNGFDAWAYGFGRHKDLIYQWSPQNPDSPVPAYRNDMTRHVNYRGYSDLFLEDGSYLRLRQVSLGYSLKKKTLDKLGIKWLRFYVRAQNPLTITKYSGYNPEVGGGVAARGLDKNTGPISSQYMLGINFNF